MRNSCKGVSNRNEECGHFDFLIKTLFVRNFSNFCTQFSQLIEQPLHKKLFELLGIPVASGLYYALQQEKLKQNYHAIRQEELNWQKIAKKYLKRKIKLLIMATIQVNSILNTRCTELCPRHCEDLVGLLPRRVKETSFKIRMLSGFGILLLILIFPK